MMVRQSLVSKLKMLGVVLVAQLALFVLPAIHDTIGFVDRVLRPERPAAPTVRFAAPVAAQGWTIVQGPDGVLMASTSRAFRNAPAWRPARVTVIANAAD